MDEAEPAASNSSRQQQNKLRGHDWLQHHCRILIPDATFCAPERPPLNSEAISTAIFMADAMSAFGATADMVGADASGIGSD